MLADLYAFLLVHENPPGQTSPQQDEAVTVTRQACAGLYVDGLAPFHRCHRSAVRI